MKPRSSAEEETLLGLALTNNPEQFAKAVKKWVFQLSPTEAEREAKQAALKQHLKVFPADGGYKISGWFTALNGLQLDRALRKIIGVPSQSDTRDHSQRCADAFMDVLYIGREAGEGEHRDVVNLSPQQLAQSDTEHRYIAGEHDVGRANAHGVANTGIPQSAHGREKETGGTPNAIGRRLPRTQILVHVPLATLVQTEKAMRTGCSAGFTDDGGEKAGSVGARGRGSPPPPTTRNDSHPRREGEEWTGEGTCHVSEVGLGRHGECLDSRRELSAQLGETLGEIKAGLAVGLLGGFEPATLEDGTALAPSELATLLCDSSLSRIVFSAHSEPLDASRAQRTFSTTQTKAVLARDRTCRYPNCNRGSEVSEIHHAQEWEKGGTTVVDNAVLLCWHHHQTVHSNAVTITHHAGGFIFSRPDGSLIGVRRHEGGTP